MNEAVVTRFAPSPTGSFHIGSARTALFNYLYTKKYNGKFILRIEDTDKERSKPEHETEIQESMSWLSLEWDSFHRQSDRTEVYKEALITIIENGNAYISKEEKEGGRSEVIRFKNPNKIIEFEDAVRGNVKFDTTDLGDFIIAKSETEPLYHFTVTVDDHQMGVTNVIRAEDHISNTPRQILIIEALGCTRPKYAHIPLILAPDRSKLSKRHGAISVMEFKQKGYLPEALVNYLALLGWNPGNNQEILSTDDLIESFSLEAVQKGGALFDEEKLRWVNKSHLTKFISEKEQYAAFKTRFLASNTPEKKSWSFSEKYLFSVWKIFKDRISVYGDIEKFLNEGEFDYFFEKPKYDSDKMLWKQQEKNDAVRHLEFVIEKLKDMDENKYSHDTIKNSIWNYADKEGRGDVLWPVRYALSGKERSPDPFSLASTLGKEETLNRLNEAISYLKHGKL